MQRCSNEEGHRPCRDRYALKSASTYIVAGLRLPQLDVLRREADNVTMLIDNAGSSTASPNIDANVVIDMRTELVVRIGGELTAGL